MQNSEMPRCPFVGPRPFKAADSHFFVGRESDLVEVEQELLSTRLTILHGRSGVGKSSLLQAKVEPTLNEDPHTVCVYWGRWKTQDALGDLRKELAQRLRSRDCEVSDVAPLDEQMDMATRAAVPVSVFLLLDQFEEYLANPNDQFDAEIARSVNRRNLRAGILIGIRDDCLSDLDHLDSRIPGLRANQTGLPPLDDAAVARAIREPLLMVGASCDEALPDRIIREVRGARWREARFPTVELAYIQLVMKEFYDSVAAFVDGPIRLTLAALDSRLRGVEGIISQYFQERIDKLPDNGGNICLKIFQHLTTPARHRVALSTDALHDYADSSPEQLQNVIETLRQERIIHPIGQGQYEIPSDSMASVIRDWLDERLADEAAEAQKREAIQKAIDDQSKELQNRVLSAERRAQDAEIKAGISNARRLCLQAEVLAPGNSQLALLLAMHAANMSWGEFLRLRDSAWKKSVSDTVAQAERSLRAAVERALLDRGAAGTDGALWRLPDVTAEELPALFALARTCLTRDLTPEEADLYLDAAPGAPVPLLPPALDLGGGSVTSPAPPPQTVLESDLSFGIPEESDNAETSTE